MSKGKQYQFRTLGPMLLELGHESYNQHFKSVLISSLAGLAWPDCIIQLQLPFLITFSFNTSSDVNRACGVTHTFSNSSVN